jgi:hypothetical protein
MPTNDAIRFSDQDVLAQQHIGKEVTASSREWRRGSHGTASRRESRWTSAIASAASTSHLEIVH